VAGELHACAAAGGEHGCGRADRTGAEDEEALAGQSAFGGGHALEGRHRGGGGGEAAARVAEQRDDEGRRHRLLRPAQHVDGDVDLAPADEDAGAAHALRAAREDGVLGEAGDVARRHAAIGLGVLEAGVDGHVDVEGAHVAGGGEHVQDGGLFHCFSDVT
jgi:hypothetical protein